MITVGQGPENPEAYGFTDPVSRVLTIVQVTRSFLFSVTLSPDCRTCGTEDEKERLRGRA